MQAPELMHRKAYDYKADTWSLGVLLYEMLGGGCYPFMEPGDSIQSLVNKICFAEPAPLPGGTQVSTETSALLRGLLCKDPAERPSLASVLCTPFLQPFINKVFKDARVPPAEGSHVMAQLTLRSFESLREQMERLYPPAKPAAAAQARGAEPVAAPPTPSPTPARPAGSRPQSPLAAALPARPSSRPQSPLNCEGGWVDRAENVSPPVPRSPRSPSRPASALDRPRQQDLPQLPAVTQQQRSAAPAVAGGIYQDKIRALQADLDRLALQEVARQQEQRRAPSPARARGRPDDRSISFQPHDPARAARSPSPFRGGGTPRSGVGAR